MAPRYNPPTKVTTVQIPFLAIVTQVDPSWNRWKHYELQYEFTRRNFFADPYHRGPYDPKFDNPTIVDGPYNVTDPGTLNPRPNLFTLDGSIMDGSDVLA